MKIGVHKDGKRDDEAVEKAFAFVDWLVRLTTEGDADLGIAALPAVQPNYALNTIVTASQRAGSLEEAERAFDLLVKHGYEPDVFTYTALIDVTARSGDVRAAIAVRLLSVATSHTTRRLVLTFPTDYAIEIRRDADVVVTAEHCHVHDADPLDRVQRQRGSRPVPRVPRPRPRGQHV